MNKMLNEHWSKPVWITSRSYFSNAEKAKTIITNSKWWTHHVLEGLSSDLWARLPSQFHIESLRKSFEEIGINLDDPEHCNEIEGFLKTLHQDGILIKEFSANPEPIRTRTNERSETEQISSVAAEFNEGLSRDGILSSTFFELTYRCNERCVHCFNPRSMFDHSKDLTTDEVFQILRELESMGAYSVTLSGGEASLRKDFFDILHEAKRLNFAVSVFTNGQQPETQVHKLALLFPQTVGVSLYSVNPEIHDATTRCKGSHENTIRTIKVLRDHGIRVTVKCPLMNHTVYGYKKIFEFCDEIGAIPQFDFHISPATDGNAACSIHQILDPDILSLLFRDARLNLYVDTKQPDQGRHGKPVGGPVCGAGRESLSICPDGTVYPCNSLPIKLGNVRDGGIRKIWEDSPALAAWKTVSWKDYNECGLYHECSYCNFCPGMPQLETGDLFEKSKTCCATAKRRKDLMFELQNGNDPLTSYRSGNTDSFGHDLSFRSPLEALPVSISVKMEGEHYLERIEEIRRSGNSIRRTIPCQEFSPASENPDSEFVSLFFETGR